MQLPSQSSSVSVLSLAAARRRNRSLLLVTSLPLLVACIIAAGIRIMGSLTHARRAVARPGAANETQAAALAMALCGRITGAPAEVLEATYYSNGAGTQVRQWDEWQILCRAGTSRYHLRIDADRREVMVLRRERGAAVAAQPNGDLPARRLRWPEAERWARHYLRLAGLPEPAPAGLLRNIDASYDFTYRCGGGGANGVKRTLRVRIDPADGSLMHLLNVIYRSSPPPARLRKAALLSAGVRPAAPPVWKPGPLSGPGPGRPTPLHNPPRPD
jgi:hypothetical protein